MLRNGWLLSEDGQAFLLMCQTNYLISSMGNLESNEISCYMLLYDNFKKVEASSCLSFQSKKLHFDCIFNKSLARLEANFNNFKNKFFNL